MTVLDHRLLRAHGFAVMDPCVVEASLWPELPSASLAPRQLASRSRLLPSLLDLRGLSADRVGDLLDKAVRWQRENATPYFSALVCASGDMHHVAAALKPRFVIRRVGASAASLLRWHDPRVFEHLLRIFSPARIKHLLQPVDEWTWRNRKGVWITCRPVEERPDRRGVDEATWRQLLRLALVNRIIGELEPSADRPGGDDAADTVLGLLNRAYDVHGFTQEADCRLYVMQALEYGLSIHDHPRVMSCVQQVQAGCSTYVGACSRLSADELHAWTQSNTHPRTEENGV